MDGLAPGRTGWRDGAWTSPGYRSSRTRALWTYGLLVGSAVVAGSAVLHLVSGPALVDRVVAGTAGADEVAQFDSASAGYAGANWLLLFTTGAAFLAWMSRSVDNVPTLGAGTPEHSPRWSIGWWFIPFANFIQPYRVVKELHGRLALDASLGGGGIILAWWLTFLAGNFMNRASSALFNGQTAASLQAGMWVGALAEVVIVISAGLAIVVVREIEGRQRARAEQRGFMSALPGAPAPAPTAPAPARPALSATTAIPTSGVAFCPSCGVARFAGAQYCAACGRDLAPLDRIAGGVGGGDDDRSV